MLGSGKTAGGNLPGVLPLNQATVRGAETYEPKRRMHNPTYFAALDDVVTVKMRPMRATRIPRTIW